MNNAWDSLSPGLKELVCEFGWLPFKSNRGCESGMIIRALNFRYAREGTFFVLIKNATLEEWNRFGVVSGWTMRGYDPDDCWKAVPCGWQSPTANIFENNSISNTFRMIEI